MKAYVTVTGVVFGLLAVIHVWRVTVERNLMTEPWYLLITVATAALSIWAFRLLWRRRP